MKKLPIVIILTTGGTIAARPFRLAREVVPSFSGDDLVNAVPELTNHARVDTFEFSRIESSHMTPELWLKLSVETDRILAVPDVKGVVITHGTDTMAECALFLDLILRNLKKPVVVTGAMRHALEPKPDGPANLLNSVIQICSPDSNFNCVTINMHGRIHAACHARKTHSTRTDAFTSGKHKPLGRITRGRLVVSGEKVGHIKIRRPKSLPYVPLLTTYTGDDGKLIRQAVDNGARGMVIEAMGAGNMNPAAYDAVEYALSKQIPVVISTRVPEGGCAPIYGGPGGGYTLHGKGAALATFPDACKARILLMLALTRKNPSVDKIKKLFNKNPFDISTVT